MGNRSELGDGKLVGHVFQHSLFFSQIKIHLWLPLVKALALKLRAETNQIRPSHRAAFVRVETAPHAKLPNLI
jgi:hypothetical protein